MKESGKPKLLKKIIDIVYPRRCYACGQISWGDDETYVCKSCTKKLKYIGGNACLKCGKLLLDNEKSLCSECEKGNRHFDSGAALLLYDDTMQKSIYMFKEYHRAEYGEYYASDLFSKYETYYRELKPDMIIPVPISKKKLKKRGYNQSEIIAKRLGGLLKVKVESDVLYKRDTIEQKTLDATERKKNLKKAFILQRNIVQSKTVMLVDDVFTTGSTIDTIAELLKDAGATKVHFTTVCIGSD